MNTWRLFWATMRGGNLPPQPRIWEWVITAAGFVGLWAWVTAAHFPGFGVAVVVLAVGFVLRRYELAPILTLDEEWQLWLMEEA